MHHNLQASHVGNRTNSATNLVEEIDVYQYLVLRKEGEDGPDVKGGPLDSLIVHATKVQKVCDSGESNISSIYECQHEMQRSSNHLNILVWQDSLAAVYSNI